MDLEKRNKEIVDLFSGIQTWELKYKKLIDLGKESQGFPEDEKIEDNLVRGCTSKVWIICKKQENGELLFFADSDALIVKGLVTLLVRFYSKLKPKEILGLKPTFISQLRLQRHLTASRANGLQSMVKQIQFYALAFSAQA